jgi:hypothetical protein
MWVRLVWALSVLIATLGCAARQTTNRAEGPLSVDYRREGGPRSDFALVVPAHGYARVTAHHTLAGALDGPAGFFGASLGKQRRAELEHWVTAGNLLSRHDEADFSAENTGLLRLSRGDRTASLSLGASDEATRQLLSVLDGLVSESLSRPVAALRLEAKARLDGPNAKVKSRFVHLGEQPIEIALTHATEPVRLRAVLERGGKLVDEVLLQSSDLARLTNAGQLPRGWHRIEPGRTWVLPSFQVPLPQRYEGLYARVEASVWARTKGQKPALVSVTSQSVSVEAEEEPEAPDSGE